MFVTVTDVFFKRRFELLFEAIVAKLHCDLCDKANCPNLLKTFKDK